MPRFSNFSAAAALIADPTRAAMLAALLDGRALPAGELAVASGISPQTASSHLAKLLEGGLLSMEIQGRHRYYRLAGRDVARALEQLATLSPPSPPRALSPAARDLAFCRRCYDHLAGRVGVAVTEALQQRRYIVEGSDRAFGVTAAGAEWFAQRGVDMKERRLAGRQCLDWTERRHHLGGSLGVRFMSALCAAGLLRRAKDSRAMTVTPAGWRELQRHLGLDARRVSA